MQHRVRIGYFCTRVDTNVKAKNLRVKRNVKSEFQSRTIISIFIYICFLSAMSTSLSYYFEQAPTQAPFNPTCTKPQNVDISMLDEESKLLLSRDSDNFCSPHSKVLEFLYFAFFTNCFKLPRQFKTLIANTTSNAFLPDNIYRYSEVSKSVEEIMPVQETLVLHLEPVKRLLKVCHHEPVERVGVVPVQRLTNVYLLKHAQPIQRLGIS